MLPELAAKEGKSVVTTLAMILMMAMMAMGGMGIRHAQGPDAHDRPARGPATGSPDTNAVGRAAEER